MNEKKRREERVRGRRREAGFMCEPRLCVFWLPVSGTKKNSLEPQLKPSQ